MAWADLIIGILRILVPALLDAARPRVEDAAPQPKLRRKLQNQIRRTWGLPAGRVAGAALIVAVLLCSGCARTVYIPSGEPVRLRESVKDVKVWVMGQDGKPVAGVVDLEEGWYCLPLEPEE